MKHAILITAYKDQDALIRLINQLKNDFYLYVHIDKKSNLVPAIFKYENVFVYKKYNVNWGSFHHLNVVVYLLKKAAKNNDVDYFHIILGQDFPAKSNSEIYDFININYGNSFIDFNRVTSLNIEDKKAIMDRYTMYWFTDLIAYPQSWNFKENFCIDKIIRFQRKCKVNRNHIGEFKDEKIYKGLIYASLHKNAVEYVLNYIKRNKLFLFDLKTCLISEEFFFQTILLNSNLKNTIVNNNLRYVDWSYRDNISPCILNENDYINIINSNTLFIRKTSSSSTKLIGLLHGTAKKI